MVVDALFITDLDGYRNLLTPFEEFPAKATGNSYTATPGINDWYETVKINYCETHSPVWDKEEVPDPKVGIKMVHISEEQEA